MRALRSPWGVGTLLYFVFCFSKYWIVFLSFVYFLFLSRNIWLSRCAPSGALGAGTFDGEAKFKCRRRNHHLLTFVYQIYHRIANISKYCKYIRISPDVSQKYHKYIKTRLMYNCAHLRSTKGSLTIEYFEKKLIFWVKIMGWKFFWLKIFLGENFCDEFFFWVNLFFF